MGIIKAAAGAIGGGLADQWLEVIEPEEMGSKKRSEYKRKQQYRVKWVDDPRISQSVYDAGRRRKGY